MANPLWVYVGAFLLLAWGIAHIVPTAGVVRSFGPLSGDNRKILIMAWVAEGLVLCFLGVLSALAIWRFGVDNPAAALTLRAAGCMALVMALWTLLTGSRTNVIPIKICPLVKTLAALCLLAPTF